MAKNETKSMKGAEGSRSKSGKAKPICPQCRKATTWQDNPYRPFCSARCRSLDLGAWVEEEYRVPADQNEHVDHQD